MINLRALLALFLVLVFAPLAGCPTSSGGDADDDATGDDDDTTADDDDATGDDDDATGDDDDATGDDDDVTQEEFTFTFTPAFATAGDLATMSVDLGGMDTTGAAACCNDDGEVALLQTLEGSPPGTLDGLFFFGLFSDGARTWGLESDTAIGTGDLTIAGSTIPAATPGPAAASGTIGAPFGWEAWSIDIDTADTILTVSAKNIGDAAFRPSVWLLKEDGHTFAAFNNPDSEVSEPFFASALVQDPGTWYVRIMDFATGGASTYTFDLDIVANPVDTTPAVTAEVEPNDEDPFQDLGQLNLGFHQVTGVLDTAGWNQSGSTFEWTGDIDAFEFTLPTNSQVELELDWEGTSDLDMLVYNNGGTVAPDVGTFPNDAIVIQSGATLAQPEVSTWQLAGQESYIVMVANFEGDDEQAYTLDVRVLGGP